MTHVEADIAPDPESAAALVTADVPIADPRDTIAAVLAGMEGRSFQSASHVVIVAEGTLAGVVTIEDVLAADPGSPVLAAVRGDPTVAALGTDQEVAVWNAARNNTTTVAVVDPSGRFRGLIPPATILRVLEREHDEDLARLGGYLRETESARRASSESVIRRLRHRLPWLLVGLAAAMLSAGLIGAFEDDLSRNLALAFFLPGVVYLADAVGTQTETLVIRGLSVGVGIRQVVTREVITGFLIGLVLALAFLPVAWIWQGPRLAATVAVALFAASAIATAIAMVLPSLFSHFGVDPAFGSGPLATVVQDLLTIAIYLEAARLILI